jgi:3-hydroxyacyl-[acyl-carrier-protein] dehydratase
MSVEGLELSGASLEARLPHRGGMLFARSVRVCSDERFVGTARWPQGSAAFDGHFPGHPIVPGVMLVEAGAQVAGAALNAIAEARSGSLQRDGVLAMIRRCIFHAPVRPDETVSYELAVEHATGSLVAITGKARVGERPVADISFALARTRAAEPAA